MSRGACYLLIAAVAAGLGGCAAGAPRQVAVAPPIELLAATVHGDVVDLLVRLYPPAHTSLALPRPAQDALGQALVASLREKGYAVHEPEVSSGRKAQQAPSGAMYFDYRLAPVKGDALYELQITVGTTHLSRVYLPGEQGAVLVPAGAWARRE